MKKILGLDLGTNSIGWALIKHDFNEKKGSVLGMGSRIIPMSQDIVNDFQSGNTVSQTASRTGYRGTRRLRERHLLRRERLHRVLNVLGFLPEHYARQIDWEIHPGKFIEDAEPKLAYANNHFLFLDSFEEMLADFQEKWPELLSNGRRIPYDWTIYYLRKKALSQMISKEELAWILLNFNQKRGYYQLRGEDEEVSDNKIVEYYELKIVGVENTGDIRGDSAWYNVLLENGWVYKRTSKVSLDDWIGKTREFIVTTELNSDGSIAKDKEGNEKRSFRSPGEDDWNLLKTKTEANIANSGKTIGEYVYDALLSNPSQKIRGKLIRTIERRFYRDELNLILESQQRYHSELQDKRLYSRAVKELYPQNIAHRENINNRDFKYLFIDDIIFYQRPLKSKKSLISKCRFERRYYKSEDGERVVIGLNGIPKTNPMFQEFRIWHWLNNLRIFERQALIGNKLVHDHPVTGEFLKSTEDYVDLFDFLFQRKEIKQKALLKYFGVSDTTHRWNYLDEPDKTYPCNETGILLRNRLKTVKDLPKDFLTAEKEQELWHLIYSVVDKEEYRRAIRHFMDKNRLHETFFEAFEKVPLFEKEYGAYSEKAIKKMLPLMRCGKYWSSDAIDTQTKDRVFKIINGEYDDKIKLIVREKAINLQRIEDFSFLPLWLITYIVYNRHSEEGTALRWSEPFDIMNFLQNEFRQHSLRNPIVEQVIAETMKIVSDIWKKYGNGEKGFFDEIHVELGRDLKNNADERRNISKLQTENENTNLRIKALLMELANDDSIENVRPQSPYQREALKIFEEGVNNSRDLPKEIEKISKSASPSGNDVLRYKAWLEQGYRSPYTGEVIPLTRLFTSDYQIEHIIPQARYFDDSYTNKVICESEINKLKDKQLGFEFITNHGGEKIELSRGKYVKVFDKDEYVDFIKAQYRGNSSKARKLLMSEIPEQMAERQMNNTRYISKYIIGLLSNIVREEDEFEHRAKKVIPVTGKITSELKKDWGLNAVWSELMTPRFKRLNGLTNDGIEEEGAFGCYVSSNGKRYFRTKVPFEFQKGFRLKRIDHRHHAVDAAIVACASADHVNYLNNESHTKKSRTKDEKIRIRYDLRTKLKNIEEKRIIDQKTGENKVVRVAKEFTLPWQGFPKEIKDHLELIVVSHKQNLRVINKTVNYYTNYVQQPDGNLKKELVKQVKGDNWAVRKPLHKETVYGKVLIDEGKEVSLKKAIETPELIKNKQYAEQIEAFLAQNGADVNKVYGYIRKNHKDFPLKLNVLTPGTASRVSLDISFDEKRILKKVTDSGIRKILLNHLRSEKYQNRMDEKGKSVAPEMLAFSPEGIVDMNRNIVELNDGKPHQPILKVREWEAGSRFSLGEFGNKKTKYVEAAKGTNLFFAIYVDEDNKRKFETVPLVEVIEHQKQVVKLPKSQRTPVPVKAELGKFLFSLSPSDLVYVPSLEEMDNPHIVDFNNLSPEQVNRIYKMVSCSGTECYFMKNSIASLVKSYDSKTKIGEFGSLNKMEKSVDGITIKSVCWKIKLDRLGTIQKTKY
ncbi:MAG: type II CRISPR RNA-guided endonuclease Cas9 [Bacteroidales bacterium]